MFAKTTSEAPSGFTNIKNCRASVTGYAVHKVTGLAGEMVTDGKIAFGTSYLGLGTDVRAGMATRTSGYERDPHCSVHKWSVECTKLRSHLYATKGGCGKISRVKILTLFYIYFISIKSVKHFQVSLISYKSFSFIFNHSFC